MDSAPEEIVDDLEFAHACLEGCILLLENFVTGRRFEVAVIERCGGAGRGVSEEHGR